MYQQNPCNSFLSLPSIACGLRSSFHQVNNLTLRIWADSFLLRGKKNKKKPCPDVGLHVFPSIISKGNKNMRKIYVSVH